MSFSSIHIEPACRFGKAWFTLSLILLLHILDEAINGFLHFYNENILRIRDTTGIPFPTFTFPFWFTGLICIDIWLLFLSRYALQGKRVMILLAYPFAFIMLLKSLAYFVGSLCLQQGIPGIITAPLLVYGSLGLFLATLNMKTSKTITDQPAL